MALLAEMLHILVAGLGAMCEEASQLGLQVNWAKIKIQSRLLREAQTQFHR